MSRSNRQLLRLIQMLVRGVRSGKIKLRWLIAIGVLAVGYFLLQPMLVRSLGINLPGFGDLVAGSTQTRETASTADDQTESANSPISKNKIPADKLLEEILNGNSRQVYKSAAGLRYTRGSAQGHRLKHLMAHAVDEPNRPGQHGVFDTDDPSAVVAIVDQAYLQAQTGRDTRIQNEDERIVYDVNLRQRIGYVGGQSGNRRNRPAAKHLRIVVEGDRLITAFPVNP